MRKLVVGMSVLLMLPLMAREGLGLELSERVRHDSIVAESATPVDPGKLELSLDLSNARTVSNRSAFDNSWGKTDISTVRHWEFDLTAVYGIMEELDAGIRTGYVDIKNGNRALAFGDDYDRGISDLDVFAKTRFFADELSGLTLAYIPKLTIPIGRDPQAGRIGSGQHFWSFTNRLAATQDLDVFVINADVGYMLPFGRTRKHYSRDFGVAHRNTRGILDANLGVAYPATDHFHPEVGLTYAHEFISHGNDSDVLNGVIGAVVPITEEARIRMGVELPIAGRNAARMRTLFAAVSVQF